MFYVYILLSLKDKKIYIGYSNNLKRRFQEHLEGKVKSTKGRLPVKLIYYEAFLSETDARRREIKLKQYGGTIRHLKRRIEKSLNI